MAEMLTDVSEGIQLMPGDIFFIRKDNWIHRLVRFFTGSKNEPPTIVTHTGIVVTEGSVEKALVVEALLTVRLGKLWDRYGAPLKESNKTDVAIYRVKKLKNEEIKEISYNALEYTGRWYGWVKLIAHALDWAINWIYSSFRRPSKPKTGKVKELNLFRRIACMDKYPVCSWIVVHSYLHKIDKNGEKIPIVRIVDDGIAPEMATPDDIWDFVTMPKNNIDFEEIHKLGPLQKKK